MLRRLVRSLVKILLAMATITVAILLLPRLFTILYAWPKTHHTPDAPHTPVAIVFGAGLRRDGSPSPVLRDRVTRGVELYLAGKVDKLLMSGDNSSAYYDEPTAMRDLAISLGVPEDDIVLDYAGLRTYDTCYRANAIFGLTEVTLVTQQFHLPRALYTCNALGISAIGVPADRFPSYLAPVWFWNLRETFATIVAMLDVHLARPLPILGLPEPIFPPEI
jgi:SanA protein